MIQEKKSNKLNNICSFIFAFLFCQNSFNLFKIGNTDVNLLYIVSFAYLLYLVIHLRMNILNQIKQLNKFFLLLISLFFLSIILSMISSMKFNSLDFVLTSIKGYIVLFVVIIYIVEAKRISFNTWFIKGLFFGFFINVTMSLIQYVSFNSLGYAINLYRIFPTKAYQTCVTWDLYYSSGAKNLGEWFIFNYRASGLFLETSYYAVFSSIVVIILWRYKNQINKYLFYVLIVINIVLISLSKTGNALMYFSIVLICLSFSHDNNCTRFSFIRFFNILLLYLTTFVIILSIDNSYIDLLFDGIKDVNIFNKNNQVRFEAMSGSISAWEDNIFGIGFNNSSKFIYGTYSDSNSSLNYFFAILLECGILGPILLTILYLDLIYNGAKLKNAFIVLLSIALAVFQFGNGIQFDFIPLGLAFGFVFSEIEAKENFAISLRNNLNYELLY